MIYIHFATQRYTAFLATTPCSCGWMRKHVFMNIFVVGHQRIILTGVLPITTCYQFKNRAKIEWYLQMYAWSIVSFKSKFKIFIHQLEVEWEYRLGRMTIINRVGCNGGLFINDKKITIFAFFILSDNLFVFSHNCMIIYFVFNIFANSAAQNMLIKTSIQLYFKSACDIHLK